MSGMANSTASNNHSPWVMADSLVFAPASALAELYNYSGDGKSAQQPTEEIGRTLRHQFPVLWRDAVLRIQFVDSGNAQQGFQAVAIKQITTALRHISILLNNALN